MARLFSGFDELLASGAAECPDKVALVFGEGPEQVSWAELDQVVRARADELRALGKTSMAIVCDGSYPCVCELLAANLAGMQIALIDSQVPDPLLAALIMGAMADAVWTAKPERTEALSSHLGGGVTDGERRVLFLTSGTTHRSKYVALSDKSLMASAWNGSELLPLTETDRLLCMLPLAHVFGFVCGLLWGLSCRAEVALGRGMRHYMDDCTHFEPTAVSVVPNLLAFLMGKGLLNEGLGLVLVGAGDCGEQLLSALAASGRRVAFGYGLTETSSGVALGQGADPHAMDICPGFEVKIADDGEVLVSSADAMMEGYYLKPDDTAEVLVDGVLHTGDLGFIDEAGRLHITGRKKEMLVLGSGTKIFLPEYEALLQADLGTIEAAITLVDGTVTMVLGDTGFDADEARRRIAPVMAETPRAQQVLKVVELGHALPRTATGKLKRWELQSLLEA